MPTPTINFEKELWDAANELRSAVSENNYKICIHPLFFVKHLSERYEMLHDELSSLMKDPQSDYYTMDKAQIMYSLADHDEYKARNAFVILQTASWQYFKDNAELDDIKVKIGDAYDVIQDLLIAYNPQLNNLLPRIFIKSELSAKQTGGIINLLPHPKVSEMNIPESVCRGVSLNATSVAMRWPNESDSGQFWFF